MTTSKDYHIKAVVENGKWLDALLKIALLLTLTVLIIKLTGKDEFTLPVIDVVLKTSQAWIIYVALTLAHLYTTILFTNAVYKLADTKSALRCRQAFSEVATSGGILVRGLVPRVRRSSFGRLIQVSWERDDPAVWPALLAIVLLILAIVPFDLTDLAHFAIMLDLALVIAAANWILGSNWIARLSALGVLLARVEPEPRPTLQLKMSFTNGDTQLIQVGEEFSESHLKEFEAQPRLFQDAHLDEDGTLYWDIGPRIDADALYGRNMAYWVRLEKAPWMPNWTTTGSSSGNVRYIHSSASQRESRLSSMLSLVSSSPDPAAGRSCTMGCLFFIVVVGLIAFNIYAFLA